MTHVVPVESDASTHTRRTADSREGPARGRARRRSGLLVPLVLLLVAGGGGLVWQHWQHAVPVAPAAGLPPPRVTVSPPLRETVTPTTGFLGQFSAVDSVDLRAQVGGTLTAIHFRDGQIVHKGDPLFTIDPRPYQIKLAEAAAQVQTAQARQALAEAELWRAKQLRSSNFSTAESVDQRTADLRSAQAAAAAAQAALADARLDLGYTEITAPFTGRIGAHQISVGSLVSGSRGGAGGTTLLATIVSLDPIHLDFDMSEADYLAYRASHPATGTGGSDVAISLDGDGHYNRHGTLDFVDNVLNRDSGTIHARATVPNPDFLITPGQFARLRLSVGRPAPALLVPDAAIVPDQSREMVMTVAPDGTVVPKTVRIGDLVHGLRLVRSGLAPGDRVIIDGLMRARPGAKVTPIGGAIAPQADSR